MDSQPWGQQPACRAQGRAAAGTIHRHPQRLLLDTSLPMQVLASPSWDQPGTRAGHSWQQLARTGCAVAHWSRVRSSPAGMGRGSFPSPRTHRHVPVCVLMCTELCTQPCVHTFRNGAWTGQHCLQPPPTNHQKCRLGELRNHNNTQGLVEVFFKGWRFRISLRNFWSEIKPSFLFSK